MAKVIMVQGTMSNAGKSLIVAGLCRIFAQDGYRVAPFKSQNMALNSYITEDGLEMGRAQVMQAEAAGVKPSVLMNPILLKPTNDVGSQVIVKGEVLGNMQARDYFAYKKKLIPTICEAFSELEKQADIIVMEGAGSPAEINLKSDDIVNMGLAKLVDAPVLLVGDIDRGGVFAQLLGTLMLLEEDEKARVKGLIINKFRGDKTILDPGVEMLEERGGVKVAGVVPYMHLSIEDEDSLSSQLDNHDVGVIDLAVIRFPRISNFTDFNVFERLEGVSVRYVSSVQELGQPDMIFLPGSKNTMGDLCWMRQNGLEAAVKKLAVHIPVWGICGGYQMLGRTISDPHGVENENSLREPLYPAHCEAIFHEPDTIAVERIKRDGALPLRGMELPPRETRRQSHAADENSLREPLRGMELIDTDTTLMPEKMRTQICGNFENVTGIFSTLSRLEFSGYEIHMGKTTVSTGEHQTQQNGTEKNLSRRTQLPLVHMADGRTDGVQRMEKGGEAPGVYGSYVHGIFDEGDIAVRIVQALADKKGVSWKPEAGGDYHAFKEQQYDKLAQGLREHLDMEYVYSILQESRISS